MEQLQQLSGGVAVITGAGSGIGEGLARYAAELGMKVVLADISAERIERVAAEIAAGGGEVLSVPTDVSDPAALDRLADTTYAHFGSVRLLVNNAGVETLGFSWEIPAETWQKTIGINICGVVHGVRAFAPRMIASTEKSFIANTSSVGGLGIMPIQTPYIMSKHAVLAFSECLRMEMQVKQANVQVSVILPGPVATRIFTDSDAASDTVSIYHRKVMQDMLESAGISGDEAARRIMPQIAAGDFWASTHPEMTREYARNRADSLSHLQDPQLSAELMAMLQDSQP